MQNTINTFKPGDKVVVAVRTFHTEDSHQKDDWNNGWVPKMEKCVGSGRVFTVRFVSTYGVYFIDDEFGYGWDWKSLAFADGYNAPPQPTKQELICQKIKSMYKRREAAGYRF